MRTALEQIKHELGADAVIMSNKKIPEGVELMAAVDYGQHVSPSQETVSSSDADQSNNAIERNVDNDVVSIGHSHSQSTPSDMPASQSSVSSGQEPVDSLSALLQRKVQLQSHQNKQAATSQSETEENIEQQLKNFTDRLEQGVLTSTKSSGNTSVHSKKPDTTIGNARSHKSNNVPEMARNNQSQSSTQPMMGTSAEIEQMRQEMLSMRQLLEHQISGLMWQDMAQKDPTKALMVNRLMALGLTEHIADQIACCLPTHTNEQEAWDAAKSLLAQQLNTTNNDIIHRGGVVSLVGPTGVGKTTTIAKLAARFAQIHGADQVAMISTDSYRIAGFEQLTTYGRIIGCQVKLAKNAEALDTLLQQYSNKKLVLIDTAGMGQRDMRLAQHLATLITNSRVRIRNYLVLAANTQTRVMQENVERFKKVPLAGCIYTKLDESLSVGEIIATSIQNGLPIGYLTDGQRVPEDIKVANTEKLVTLADRLATKVNCQNSWRPMPATQAVGL